MSAQNLCSISRSIYPSDYPRTILQTIRNGCGQKRGLATHHSPRRLRPSNVPSQIDRSRSGENLEQTQVYNFNPWGRLLDPKRAWRMAQKPTRGSAAGARQNFHIQFVTVPTADTRGTAVILHFDDERYVFGQISEGFQRACIQRGIGLRKARNLFLSGLTTWQTHGGLIGLILSVADVQLRADADNPDAAGKERLHIHGPPKLQHTIACARRFVFRTGMPLTVHESKGREFKWQDQPTWSDEHIRVWSIPIQNGVSASAVSQTTDGMQAESERANGEQLTDDPVSLADDVEQEQALRKKIVSDMFESDWQRDRLFERPFRDVRMPATVWIRNSESKELEGFRCLTHDSAPEISPEQIVLVRDPWPASLVEELPTAANLPADVAVSYIVKGYPQRGTFDKNKAKELNLKPGPYFSKLTAGDSVTLDDGRVITPDMVIGPSREGKGFAFFDVPSINHLAYLVNLLAIRPAAMLEGVSIVLWSLGTNVSSDLMFQPILDSMPDVKHILNDVSGSPNAIAYESVAMSSLLTSRIAPTHFPVLNFDNATAYDANVTSHESLDFSSLAESKGTSAGKPGAKIWIQPEYKLDDNESQQIFAVDNIEDPEVARTLKELQIAQQNSHIGNSDLTEPEIITLGTGSALPSKYRNVSATLLRMPGDQGNYLFDAGENTVGQLKRIYPAPQFRDLLRNLRAIWISHLHADHHLGTISVLAERAKAFEGCAQVVDRTIYLISETGIHDFIREYSSVEPAVFAQAGMVPIINTEDGGTTLHREPFDFNQTPYAIRKIESVRVSHCTGAQAVSITFKNGFKISYSGDCRPSWWFCKIGMDSDVLIHEATFDNDMQGDAWAKKHCTTAEALGVALNMRAKNVVLTHFSQRYHKIPNVENMKLQNEMYFEEVNDEEEEGPVDDGTAVGVTNAPSKASQPDGFSSGDRRTVRTVDTDGPNMHIAVAFDYMRFKVSEIAGLKHIYPKIQQMFDEQEAKAEKARAAARAKDEEAAEKKRQKFPPKKSKEPKQKQQKREEAGDANGAVVESTTGEITNDVGDGVEAETKQINDAPNLADNAASAAETPMSKKALKRLANEEARKERERKRLRQEQHQLERMAQAPTSQQEQVQVQPGPV